MDYKITHEQVRTDLQAHSVGCYDGQPGTGTGKWMVSFVYPDGTVQEFDGTRWVEAKPIRSANLFAGAPLLPV